MAPKRENRPLKLILMNENYCIFNQISLKYILKGPVNNGEVSVKTIACW